MGMPARGAARGELDLLLNEIGGALRFQFRTESLLRPGKRHMRVGVDVSVDRARRQDIVIPSTDRGGRQG